MKLWIMFCNLIVLTCIVIIILSNYPDKQEELEHRITLLYRAIYFVAQRPHQLGLDGVFGMVLAEAQVRQLLKHENVKYIRKPYVDLLYEILELTPIPRRKTDVLETGEEYTLTLNEILNRPEMWMRPITWSSGLLGPKPSPHENNTEASIRKIFGQGAPDGHEGDRCMLQLAEGWIKGVCQVSDECAEIILRDDNARGYPLTHRLLYVQIAVALKCSEHESTPFEQMIPAYCKLIWQDAIDMEDVDFVFTSKDLIIEQVLLCGMEGFIEFVNEHYANLILSWKNPIPCWTAFGFEDPELHRSKRSSTPMDFGCESHTTSLAAASLALLIRHSVETLQ